MKNAVLIVVFIVLAAGIIVGGMWYSAKISERSTQSAAQAGVAAQAAQSQIMADIKINDVVVGTGPQAQNGETITVNYEGTLDNGTVFDSSYKRGQPFSFVLGAGQVIMGWDLGVLGMKVGGKRELTIPGDLAYGAAGIPAAGIGPNATLHFSVELLSVSSTTAQ
jgi:FKBP-type peptidyl-prolyl cis-trans isomerase